MLHAWKDSPVYPILQCELIYRCLTTDSSSASYSASLNLIFFMYKINRLHYMFIKFLSFTDFKFNKKITEAHALSCEMFTYSYFTAVAH